MFRKFGFITLLVKDLDEATHFYIDKLDFVKKQDNKLPNGYRWLSVAPKNQTDVAIVFVLADTGAKQQRVGTQVANHVLLTLETDNCSRDYQLYKSRGVKFYGEPKTMPWGKEVVFEDLYGNRIDLIEVIPGAAV